MSKSEQVGEDGFHSAAMITERDRERYIPDAYVVVEVSLQRIKRLMGSRHNGVCGAIAAGNGKACEGR